MEHCKSQPNNRVLPRLRPPTNRLSDSSRSKELFTSLCACRIWKEESTVLCTGMRSVNGGRVAEFPDSGRVPFEDKLETPLGLMGSVGDPPLQFPLGGTARGRHACRPYIGHMSEATRVILQELEFATRSCRPQRPAG